MKGILNLQKFIREIPDFPKQGILFRDINPLLQDAEAWSLTIELMADQIREIRPTKIVGIESRGFIFAAALSVKLQTAMALVRKKGKLPSKTERHSYALEYGVDEIEMQVDSLSAHDRVVVVDDVLATGGTMAAAITLCEKIGSNVLAAQVLIELSALNGRKMFSATPCHSLFQY